MKTTSLSIGSAIRETLVRHGVDKRVSKIFPLVVDDAKLPYILYRRAGFSQQAVKTHVKTPDVVEIEIACFAATYSESVEIAELVREALAMEVRKHTGVASWLMRASISWTMHLYRAYGLK